MSIHTKFASIVVIVASAVAFALQPHDQTSPTAAVRGLVAATANADAPAILAHLAIPADRMPEDPAADFTTRPTPTIAAKVELHDLRERPRTDPNVAVVEVDMSHVSAEDMVGIAIAGAFAQAFGGGDAAWEEALAAMEALPASARSTVLVTLVQEGGAWRIAFDGRNDEILFLLALAML